MKYVVVGGGIAGVSCAYELLKNLRSPDDEVVLISASEHVKTVSNWTKLGQFAEYFTVTESSLFPVDKRFTFMKRRVTGWISREKVLQTVAGAVSYDRLNIATGAWPRSPYKSSKIFVLRDADSATRLQQLLKDKKSVAIIGNGGIATELVYELRNVNIDWIIRDRYPSSVFFLPEVSKFLERRVLAGRTEGSKTAGLIKRERFEVEPTASGDGCALGPDWNSSVLLKGGSEDHQVHFHCSTEVLSVREENNWLELTLSDGSTIVSELAIWAIGVDPATELWKEDVFACGDVCTVNWKNRSTSWKQMRLWTQARQMGLYAARTMLAAGGEKTELDFCFELFAHVTYFCGMKVVLIGDYKAERQPADVWYTRERIIGEDEYVCCVMAHHRVVGATLIGETHLEETLENLILNQTDLSQLEEHFLDPGIDIEDYFD